MGSYYKVLKENPEKLDRERERVKNILNDRYKNDPYYRERCKEYSK